MRLADDEPMAIETVCIPVAMAPTLGDESLDHSLYDVLHHRFGIRPVAATSTISAMLPRDDQADLLGVPVTHACLQVDMIGVESRGRTVMLASCIYRADRYQVRVAMAAEGRSQRRSEVVGL